MKIPGLLYSILLAAAAALIEYFTQGPGSSMSYAPIIIAVVPVLLKLVAVNTSEPEPTQPSAQARGFGDAVTPAKPSKVQRFLLG